MSSTREPATASPRAERRSPGVEAGLCPVSSDPGAPVGWSTVAAVVSRPLPPRQGFRLCAGADCPVVYFGDRGTLFEVTDLHAVPAFKRSEGGLLCFCFGVTRRALEQEWERGGGERGSALERQIRERTRAGDCACEVRNPSGRCCLGAIARFRGALAARTAD